MRASNPPPTAMMILVLRGMDGYGGQVIMGLLPNGKIVVFATQK